MRGKKEISFKLYKELKRIGVIPNKVNAKNVGKSDYSKNLIQPWVVFNSYKNLNYQECDLIKRILRTKKGESRLLDLEKSKHILDELIRQEKFKMEKEEETVEEVEAEAVEAEEIPFSVKVEAAVLLKQPNFIHENRHNWRCSIVVNKTKYNVHYHSINNSTIYVYNEEGEEVKTIRVNDWIMNNNLYSSPRVNH